MPVFVVAYDESRAVPMPVFSLTHESLRIERSVLVIARLTSRFDLRAMGAS